jgi:hypothetical protein
MMINITSEMIFLTSCVWRREKIMPAPNVFYVMDGLKNALLWANLILIMELEYIFELYRIANGLENIEGISGSSQELPQNDNFTPGNME